MTYIIENIFMLLNYIMSNRNILILYRKNEYTGLINLKSLSHLIGFLSS